MKKLLILSVTTILIFAGYVLVGDYQAKWEPVDGCAVVGGVCYFRSPLSCPNGNSTSWCDTVLCTSNGAIPNCPVSGQIWTMRKVSDYFASINPTEHGGYTSFTSHDIYCLQEQRCGSNCNPNNAGTAYYCAGGAVRDDANSKVQEYLLSGTVCP